MREKKQGLTKHIFLRSKKNPSGGGSFDIKSNRFWPNANLAVFWSTKDRPLGDQPVIICDQIKDPLCPILFFCWHFSLHSSLHLFWPATSYPNYLSSPLQRPWTSFNFSGLIQYWRICNHFLILERPFYLVCPVNLSKPPLNPSGDPPCNHFNSLALLKPPKLQSLLGRFLHLLTVFAFGLQWNSKTGPKMKKCEIENWPVVSGHPPWCFTDQKLPLYVSIYSLFPKCIFPKCT